MSVSLPHLLLILLIGCKAIAWAQNFNALANEEREKRAIDIGLFVRNLLLNSAAASNVKSDIVRNVVNVKTSTVAPRRRTTTTRATTTTTTVAPFFFNKGPFKFPFDLSAPFNNNKFNVNNKFNNGGYINFDYNDYGVGQPQKPGRRRRPTTTTTTTTARPTTTTRAPVSQPTRRRPIPRRPYGLFGKQKKPQFEYYNDDDYNYNYEDDDDSDVDDNSATTANPPTTNRPPPPPPPPPPARPQRPPTAARARAQGRVPQLRNRLVYQFRQPDGIVNELENNCRYIGYSRSLCRYLYQ